MCAQQYKVMLKEKGAQMSDESARSDSDHQQLTDRRCGTGDRDKQRAESSIDELSKEGLWTGNNKAQSKVGRKQQ